jgi:hypothetical protein
MKQATSGIPTPALATRWPEIRGAFFAALAVDILLFILFFWLADPQSDIIRLNSGGMSLHLEFRDAVLTEKAFFLIVWDAALLTVLALFFATADPRSSQRRAGMAVAIVLLLWRIVLANVWLIAFPEWALITLGPLPERVFALGFVAILFPVKEWIFRNLQKAKKGDCDPLLDVISWHHRKDAVFNFLFVLALWAPTLGFAAHTAYAGMSIIKVLLLGCAAIQVTAESLAMFANGGAATTSVFEPSVDPD